MKMLGLLKKDCSSSSMFGQKADSLSFVKKVKHFDLIQEGIFIVWHLHTLVSLAQVEYSHWSKDGGQCWSHS